jgi:hypothetical protein
MTSGHPPPSPRPDDLAGHPDLDTLADLDAGVLDPPVAARAGRHAASCPRCSATLAAFGAVRVDLRSLPPPVLPPAVAARLDETLAQLRADPANARTPPIAAANARLPQGHGGGTAPPPAGAGLRPRPGPPVVDLAAAAERRRARARKLTGRVAASLVVAAALVGVGTAVMQDADDRGTVAQGNALPGDRSESSSGGRGRPDPADAPGGAAPTIDSVPPKTLPSYTEETLLSAIPAITARSAVDIITSAGRDGPAGPMADASRRARCTEGIAGADGVPVAVQRVLFNDQLAYVFVFAAADGSRTVIVVSSTCGIAPVPQVLFRHQD